MQLPSFWRTCLVIWAVFCGSFVPGTWAATQYWDTGIANGIQGTTTNVGWSTSSNAWSSISTGTTTPGTWTNGNDAVFNTGASSAPIATVTVFSVSANSLTFGPTVNGRVVFMPGSGALTNGAGGFFSTFDAAVVTFNSDIVLSATQTWTVGYNTTINGLVSGADALWTKAGDYTLTLANGANSFSSGLVINNGTVTASGGGTVLGTGPIEIGTVAPSNAGTFSIVTATLNVNAGAANTTTTISNLTITGGAVLVLNNPTANVTNTLNAATLARTGLGTLIIAPANSLGVREKIFFTGGTNLINGILAPWLVTTAGGGNFVSNGANGLTNATYTTSFGAANIVSNGVLTTLLADQQAYALKSVANINLNGNTLTIGDGTTAGMILSASVTNGGAAASLAFGTAEALMYIISGNTGTIAVPVSGGGGLTKFGTGTLVLSNAGLWSSDITINLGAVILSPTADLTYAHGISGLGSLQKSGSAMLTLTNDYTFGGGITVNAGTLTLSGGSLSARNFTLSGGNTTLSISNEVVSTKAGATSIVGSGSSNNVLMVLADTVWDNGGANLIVGSGAATGNVMVIEGGVVSNVGTWTVGASGNSSRNMLLLTNGGWLVSTGATPNPVQTGIGIGTGSGNSVIVTDGSLLSNSVGTLTFNGTFNTLTVSTTGKVYVGGFLNVGGSDNSVLVTSNGVISTGALGLEFTGNRGSIVVSNGGVVNGQLSFVGGANLNQATVTGTGSVWNGAISFAALSANISTNNTLTVSWGGHVFGTLSMGGQNGYANNSVIVTNGGFFINNNGGNIGRSTTGSNNLLHVTGTGSVFSNTSGDFRLGNGPNVGNGFNIDSGGTFISVGTLNVGFDSRSSNNFLTIDGATFSNGAVVIGGSGNGGSFGSGPSSYNTMTATNSQVWSSSLSIGSTIGGTGANFNTGNILSNTTWNLIAGGLTVGAGNNTGNVLTIDSGVLTNVGVVTIGSGGNAANNSLIVTNGGDFFSGTVTVGSGANSSNNAYSLGGSGGAVTVSNGLITVGNNGSGFNQMTATNATVKSAGLTIGNGSSNNTVTVQSGVVWNFLGSALTFGNGTGNVLSVVADGTSVLTNIGGITMNDTGRSLFITNATGSRNLILGSAGSFLIGNNSGFGANLLVISNQTYTSSAASIIGNGSSNNAVTILASTLWNGGAANITIGTGAATGNVLTLNGGIISNVGTVIATGVNNRVSFQSGTLSVNNLIYSNSLDFTVGNGINPASLALVSGTSTSRFQGNLVISSNATLKGTGVILTGPSKSLVITNGATVAPGNSPGILTADNVTWFGGSSFHLEVTNFTGTAGTSWDLLNVTGALTINPNGNPFIVNLDSMGNSAATVNFNASNDYTLAFVNFGNQTGFNSSDFQVNTNAFNIGGAPAPGSWGVALVGANLYLTYSALSITPDFVWSNGVTGAWSVGANWTNNLAGPTSDPARKLKFGGNGATSYTSSNDIAGSFQLNQIVLASGSTGTNTITGGTIQFVGSTPLLYQQGGGLFIISNTLNLAADTAFRGPGPGNVILASNVTGAGQLTMGGSYNLILQGSNTFTGPVLVDSSGGTLTLTHDNAIGANSLTVSNGTVASTVAYTVGRGWSNQTVLITGSGSYWTNSAALTVGTGAATGNVLTVANGGSLSVNGTLVVGTNSASGNSLQVTNGGKIFSGIVTVGQGAGARSNSFNIVGVGATTVVVSNSAIVIGTNGAAFNSLTISNAAVLSSGNIAAGIAAPSNTITVLAGATVNVLGNILRSGGGAGTGNTLTINQGIVTNVGTVVVGGGGGVNNYLTITNGGQLWSTGIALVGNTGGANSNTVTVAGNNALWNLGGSSLTNGSLNSTGNVVNVGSGGIITNVSTVVIGYRTASTGNRVQLDGGQFWATSVIATSAGNRVVLNAGTLGAVGTTYSNGTAFVVGDGVSVATLQLGNGTHKFDQGINLLTNSYLKGNGATLGATTTNTLIGGNISIGADAGNTFTVNGVIQGTASQLKKIDGGTVILAGVNTFAAPVDVNAGTLTISNSTGTGLSALAPVTVSGGNFVVNNSSGTGVAGNIAVNSGALLVNNTGVSDGIGAASTVTVGGGHVSGNGTIAGGVVLNTGTLTAGNSSLDTLTMGSLTVNGGNLPFEFLTSGLSNDQLNVTTSGGLTINGGSVLLYTNNSTVRFDAAGLYYLIQYNGSIGGAGVSAFTVSNQANNRTYNFGLSDGYVTLGIGGTGAGWNPTSPSGDTWWTNAANWGGGSGGAPVAFDQLLFDGNTKVNNTNTFTSNTKFSGIMFTNSAGAFVLNGMAAGTNAVNLVGDVINRSANTQTINLPLVLDGGSRAFNTLSGNMIVNGVISGSGVGITKTGANVLTLTGANTFSGITEIQNGVLRATDGVGLPTGSNLKINGGVLESSGNFVRATGTVAGAVQWTGSGGFSAFGGSMTVNLSGGAPLTWGAGSFVPIGSTLMFGSSTANNNVWFENAIDLNGGMRTVQVVRTATLLGALSNGGLSKTGSGTLVLAGNSTYSGDTTVNAGTMVVNGQVAGGGTFVLAGGTTLGGTGVIARTLSGAGRVAPGSSPGVLTAGQVDPTLGMDFSFEFTSLNLASYSSFNDVLRLTNAAPFTANLTSANMVDLYIQTALVDGVTNVFRGGFYADQAGNFDGRLTNATFVIHGGGTLAYVQTVASSTFVPGGYVMEFGVVSAQMVTVVPEPSLLLLCLGGMLTMWIARRRRSQSGATR